MLVRVVKMQFDINFIDEFRILFTDVKPQISNFEGCLSVQLLQHENELNTWFTISKWRSADDLENYRKSDLFIKTWAKVKPNFAAKAEAWSLIEQ
ncbi:MAG: antibiotic biosynthesis monooxygenase family protein [Bacteroidota bacterium]